MFYSVMQVIMYGSNRHIKYTLPATHIFGIESLVDSRVELNDVSASLSDITDNDYLMNIESDDDDVDDILEIVENSIVFSKGLIANEERHDGIVYKISFVCHYSFIRQFYSLFLLMYHMSIFGMNRMQLEKLFETLRKQFRFFEHEANVYIDDDSKYTIYLSKNVYLYNICVYGD